MTIILAKDNDGNDDTGDDLNSIGKDDLKASHNGDSCRGFQLDCPHQAVLNMRMVSVESFSPTPPPHQGPVFLGFPYLLHKAKNANEDRKNPLPSRHCQTRFVQCHLGRSSLFMFV